MIQPLTTAINTNPTTTTVALTTITLAPTTATIDPTTTTPFPTTTTPAPITTSAFSSITSPNSITTFAPTITTPNTTTEACQFIKEIATLKCDEIVSLTNINTNSVSDFEQIQVVYIKGKDTINFESFNFSDSETKFAENFNLILENFNRFDLKANPFDRFSQKGGVLDISESNFEFFSTSHSATLSDVCAFVKTSYNPLISSFSNMILGTLVKFTQKVCPLAFKNSHMTKFVISKITEENFLEFATLTHLENQTEDIASLLNSTIQKFEIYQSSLKNISSVLLNDDVFARLKSFILHAMNDDVQIETNLFKPFKLLKEFHLYVPDFMKFRELSNFDFLSSINSDVNIDLTNEASLEDTNNKEKQFKLKITDSSRSYLFPDDDLCDYIKFPHSRLIFPVLDSSLDCECSCTIVFLTQYYPFYRNLEELITPTVINKIKFDLKKT